MAKYCHVKLNFHWKEYDPELTDLDSYNKLQFNYFRHVLSYYDHSRIQVSSTVDDTCCVLC